MAENHTGRKLAVGALIAGAAGYVAGILTAPKSGEETRQDIKDKAVDIKQEAEAKLQAAHDELAELLNQAKSKTLALNAKARDEFNEAVVRAKDAKNKLTYLIKAVKSGETDDPQLQKALKQAKDAQKNLRKFLTN